VNASKGLIEYRFEIHSQELPGEGGEGGEKVEEKSDCDGGDWGQAIKRIPVPNVGRGDVPWWPGLRGFKVIWEEVRKIEFEGA